MDFVIIIGVFCPNKARHYPSNYNKIQIKLLRESLARMNVFSAVCLSAIICVKFSMRKIDNIMAFFFFFFSFKRFQEHSVLTNNIQKSSVF